MKKNFLILGLLTISSSLFAEEAPASQTGGYMQSFVMIFLLIVFFYFILWRPEQKRRKMQQQQREALKEGDTVTAMGLVGVVDKIFDNTVILKNTDGSKIEILKAAITEVGIHPNEKVVPLKKKK